MPSHYDKWRQLDYNGKIIDNYFVWTDETFYPLLIKIESVHLDEKIQICIKHPAVVAELFRLLDFRFKLCLFQCKS